MRLIIIQMILVFSHTVHCSIKFNNILTIKMLYFLITKYLGLNIKTFI